MTTKDNDYYDTPEECLHCVLWPVIKKFCLEHPDGYVENMLLALADVIGDQLATKGSTPYREEFIDTINRRIRERTEFISAEMQKATA
jgi:hypothetical protein